MEVQLHQLKPLLYYDSTDVQHRGKSSTLAGREASLINGGAVNRISVENEEKAKKMVPFCPRGYTGQVLQGSDKVGFAKEPG